MKRIISLAVVIVFLFSMAMTGCSSAEEVKQYTTESYTVIVNGDDCYLLAEEYEEETDSENNMNLVPIPIFPSLKAMRQAIISGSIPEDEMNAVIKGSRRNDDGSIQMCNVDKLYECIVPSGMKFRYIGWKGSSYFYQLYDETAHGSVYCVLVEAYNERLDREWLNPTDYYTMTLTKQEKVEDRAATIKYYTSGTATKTKDICYEIRSKNTSILVQEHYLLETNNSLAEVSDTVPSQVNLWITDGSNYAHGIFFGFTERPSMEWLSQFGLKEYVEKEVE